jgi:chitodextrinase
MMSKAHKLLLLSGLLCVCLAATAAVQAQTVSCTGVPAWNATTIYNPGNQIVYQNGLYQANIQIWNAAPTYCPSCGWYSFLGTCGGTTTDTTAPSVPTGLASPSKTSSSVSLTWNASTDNAGGSGVAGYDVFRSGTSAGSSTTTSFTVTGLAASTAYSFTVRARDNAGNASAQSAALSVTTSAATGTCTTLPSVPTGLTSTSTTSSSVSLSWNASTAGANCTVQYRVFQNGAQATQVAATSVTIAGLAASTTYSFTVAAINQFGSSAQSGAISVTTPSGGGAAGLRFCPYIDVSPGSSSPIMQLASNGSGNKCYTLAFILGAGCQASWFGAFPLNTAEAAGIGQRIQELKNAGGNVIISFGGAAAPELADVCPNATALAAQYQAVINMYHPMAIDFDIEDFLPNAIDMRNQALTMLTGAPPIHYTLGVLSTGMTSAQISVLQNAKSHNVNVAMVNIMAMDYGGAVADMYGAAISGANATKTQLASLGYGSAQLGITPMIGVNDSPGETFTIANANSLRANAAGASMLAFWSVGRDNGGCPGGGAASPTCSGVSQTSFQFSKILQSY